MPGAALVYVEYGPYDACGIVEHRESRLHGLQATLTRNGHSVQLVQVKDWNAVRLVVNGECVFKCDIAALDYGGDGKLDELCAQAAECVSKAY